LAKTKSATARRLAITPQYGEAQSKQMGVRGRGRSESGVASNIDITVEESVNLFDPDLILPEIVEDLEAAVLQQQKDFQATISQLQSTQKDQAAQILKVSNQLKAQSLASGVVANN
jgi:hypothetical protein